MTAGRRAVIDAGPPPARLTGEEEDQFSVVTGLCLFLV